MSIDTSKRKVDLGFISKDNIISAVASIPFGNKVGADMRYSALLHSFAVGSYDRLPGIMKIELSRAIGNANDGLNSVAAKLYADLIKKISGAKSIERADYLMYLIGCASLVDAIRLCETIYQATFEYKEYNLYYGKALVEAYGFDFDDMEANIEDFRGWLNTVIRRFNSLNIPNLPYLKSGWDYGRTILVDSPDLQHSQTYIFGVDKILSWDPTTDPNGTMLNVLTLANPTPGSKVTFGYLRSIFKQALDSYLHDDDVIDISAWVGNVYENNLLFIQDLTVDKNDVQIVYDPEALAIVENLRVAPARWSSINGTGLGTTFQVRQVNNYVSQNLSATIRHTDPQFIDICNVSLPHYYNFHKSSPSYDCVARATSLKYSSFVTYTNLPTSVYVSIPLTSDFIVTDLVMYENPLNPSAATVSEGHVLTAYDGATPLYPLSHLNRFALMDNFDYHPLFVAAQLNHSGTDFDKIDGTNWTQFAPFLDFDNYAVVSNTIVNNILDAMWYVIFGLKKS